MPYRGIPYLIASSGGAPNRFDPHASSRHRMPDRRTGMRCTVEPPRRNRRGDASGCDTVLPAQARTGRPASPDLRQIDGRRLAVAAAVILCVVLFSALVGMNVARIALVYLDGEIAEASAPADAAATASLSTPASQWKRGAAPELYQADPQWSDRAFGPTTIGAGGAAPVCLAMAHIKLTGSREIGPVEAAYATQQAGFADARNPTALLTDGAGAVGLEAHAIEHAELAIRRQLVAGYPVICALGPGTFTESSTCIVLSGIDEYGQLVIRDPASCDRTDRHWTFDAILAETTGLWAYTLA